MSEEKSDAPLILGVSGLRGIVGKSLTPEVATRYAAAFGEWLKERGPQQSPEVCIGLDGRAGGEVIYEAAIEGLLRSGCRVKKLGVVATPTVGCSLCYSGPGYTTGNGGMVVTASHNPAEWNGLKCLVDDSIWSSDTVPTAIARATSASEAAEIIELFHAMEPVDGDIDRSLLSEDFDATSLHACCIGEVKGSGDFKTFSYEFASFGAKYKCVVDSVNCSGSIGAGLVLDFEKQEWTQLYGDGSGVFPHTPEPTRENLSGEGGLCDAVPGLNADIGFAQDPDADRLAIVDEKGEYIGEEYTLVLCAMALLEAIGEGKRSEASDASASASEDSDRVLTPAARNDGAPVLVTNLSTSRMVEDVATHYGARVERTPVGEANVVQRMKELAEAGERVVLGGEGNGGVIWPEVVYVRDSLSGMALVLALMARTGKTVSELVSEINSMSPGGNGYAIVKRKAKIASKADADPAVRAVEKWAREDGGGIAGARVDLQDGVRVDFDGGDEGEWVGSWVHVRASNTEAIMRLICEAPSEKIAGEILAQVEAAIGRG